MTPDLASLLDALRQARRDLSQQMALQLEREPERVMPDAGLLHLAASVHQAIAAVEAAHVDETADGG